MPRRGRKHFVLVKGAESAMLSFRDEIARDLGYGEVGDEDAFKRLTTTQAGDIGGEMVRRIQAAGEWAILKRYQNNEQRLMPPDILPDIAKIRNVTNTGQQPS